MVLSDMLLYRMSKLEEAKALMRERDEIDAKIEENMKILEANNCDMNTPLVDAEGFPVATIDVYSVRHARHDIICLRNDARALTDKLTLALEEAHEEQKTSEPMDHSGDNEQNGAETAHRTSNTPFAKVSTVTSGSPAWESGIKEGDLLLQFGPLHRGNFHELPQLAEVTSKSEGKPIRVTVLRSLRPVRLEIVPQKWAGKGLLGCGIVPETTSQIL